MPAVALRPDRGPGVRDFITRLSLFSSHSWQREGGANTLAATRPQLIRRWNFSPSGKSRFRNVPLVGLATTRRILTPIDGCLAHQSWRKATDIFLDTDTLGNTHSSGQLGGRKHQKLYEYDEATGIKGEMVSVSMCSVFLPTHDLWQLQNCQAAPTPLACASGIDKRKRGQTPLSQAD
ncbi:hypothetical protein CMUS01_01361 [Colletotrichum musicola]|uniref:Uncharacterized protein n=1 Tax=Colletotrichum musicola TaxID=2175873 RepID=A0A8H6U8K2_9PEZI|nr:hypothetical protein CMUS01_01361 [Colletotrichum musicola]